MHCCRALTLALARLSCFVRVTDYKQNAISRKLFTLYVFYDIDYKCRLWLMEDM